MTLEPRVPRRLLRWVEVAALLGAAACADPLNTPRLGETGGSIGGLGGGGGTGGFAGEGGSEGTSGSGGDGTGGFSGSVGGTGGIGGNGGNAEAFPSWFADDSLWAFEPAAPPVDEACVTLSADPAKLPLPVLRWESCGDGCERAGTLLGESAAAAVNKKAAIPRLSTTTRDGVETPYLKQEEWFSYKTETGSVVRTLFRIIDLSSGHTVGALQRISQIPDPPLAVCGGRVWSRENSLHLDLSISTKKPSMHQRGTFDPLSKRWIWQMPIVPSVGVETCFPLEFQNGGRTFYLCGRKVYASLEPGSSDLSEFEDLGEEYFAESGADDSDLAIWTEMNVHQKGSRVRGWAPGWSKARTLLDGLVGDTCHVGLSENRIAGAMIEARGKRGCYANLGKFTVWYAARSDEGAGPTVTISPPISDLSMSLDAVSTAGEFISVQVTRQGVSNDDRDNVILVRTTDWAKRWIPPLPGKSIYHHTLTKRYLYLALTGAGAGYDYHDSVYRYDLSKFDSLGQPME